MSNSNLCLADKMEESGRHGDSIDCLSMRMSVRILIGCRTRIFSNFLPAALGATENAGVENAIRSKLQGWKMQEWKMQE